MTPRRFIREWSADAGRAFRLARSVPGAQSALLREVVQRAFAEGLTPAQARAVLGDRLVVTGNGSVVAGRDLVIHGSEVQP